MGRKVSDTVLRKTIAAGADALILLEDPLFEGLDSNSVAYVLSCAIKKIGAYDLILTGRQAGDWDSGQVGLILAEMLGIPSISLAQVGKNTTMAVSWWRRPFPWAMRWWRPGCRPW